MAKAWATLAETLTQTRRPWQRVTGPLGAMITYMRDLGWQTDSCRYWAIDQAQYDVASMSGLHCIKKFKRIGGWKLPRRRVH